MKFARSISLAFLIPLRGLAGEAVLPAATPEDWNLHFQTTVIGQGDAGFRSGYSGGSSLHEGGELRDTATMTFFLGRRLWEGAELYLNPEPTQGIGLSNALGVAGFPNGEATRAGGNEPQVNIARLFLRQTFGLGGEREQIESGKNQLAGSRDVSRLTFTLGKFAASDIFDDNQYSHDPRTQFLNWALMENGAWDYPADAKGYTFGLAVELHQKDWAIRAGVFAVPRVSNGIAIDKHIRRANGSVLEVERSYELARHPGKMRLLGYVNQAHMGRYADSLGTTFVEDVSQPRPYRYKFGLGLNVEQEVTPDLGLFMRFGWNDGRTQTLMFTEIDRTATLGLALKGTAWQRPGDVAGLAGIINGLSRDHRDYLAAGGLGFIIGDGRLRYGEEEILEAYYDFKITAALSFTVDYQFVNHPAYNRDRGPVSIFAARLHAEF